MTAAPTRPTLRWHGGKWRLAPWIIVHSPPHRLSLKHFRSVCDLEQSGDALPCPCSGTSFEVEKINTPHVQPYGGAASMLLRKPPCYAEVYNDLDDDVVNFFRVLRNPAMAARLIEQLRLTPFARAEFELSYQDAD